MQIFHFITAQYYFLHFYFFISLLQFRSRRMRPSFKEFLFYAGIFRIFFKVLDRDIIDSNSLYSFGV